MVDIDHRTIIARLSPEERRAITMKSNAPALLRLGVHGGLIFLSACLIGLRVPFWQVLMVPQGILIVFLFTLLHESIHGTAFRTPWLNERGSDLSGLLIAAAASGSAFSISPIIATPRILTTTRN